MPRFRKALRCGVFSKRSCAGKGIIPLTNPEKLTSHYRIKALQSAVRRECLKMREEDLVGGLRSDQEGWAGIPKGRITEGRLPEERVEVAAGGVNQRLDRADDALVERPFSTASALLLKQGRALFDR
jgi:hypothetical protein